LKFLLLIASLLLLSVLTLSCNPNIPDIFVFELLSQSLSKNSKGDVLLTASPTCMAQIKEPECLHGTSIMTGTQIYVGQLTLFKGKTMKQLQTESLLVPAIESYAPLETYIVNSCKKLHCSKQVEEFRVKLNGLNGISGAINNK
jgi:hypothetical protein